MESILYEKRFDTGTTAEISEDFTLPDYEPGIRRVLGVRGQAAVDGKYLSGGECEADGTVTFVLCYLDGDGRLCETSETAGFTAKLPLRPEGSDPASDSPDRFGPDDLILTAEAENVSCRVTGPRRFTLSGRVRLSVLSERECDFTLSSDPGITVRRKTRRVKTAAMSDSRGSFEVSGEIREREGRIAGAQGQITVNETRVENGRLRFRGDAWVTVLLARTDPESGGEEYLITRGRAAVEESIPIRDLPENASPLAAVFPKVLLTEFETDPASGTVRWRMEYDADAALLCCRDAEITEDAYSPSSPTEAEEKNVLCCTPAAVRNGRLTLTGKFRTPSDAEFITAWGSASVDRTAVQGGRASVTGSVRVTAVTRSGGEFSTDEIVLPLRYEWEARENAPDAENGSLPGRVEAGIAEIAARPSVSDGGTDWTVTAEIWLAAALMAEEPVRGVVRLDPAGEGGKEGGSVVRVYVPEPGETAWDVEKRFRLAEEAVMADGVYVI